MVNVRDRKRLPYVPLPRDLRKHVRVTPNYANFYGAYGYHGKSKRFSVKVAVPRNMNHRVLYMLIRRSCNRILNGWVPNVPNGTIFRSFGDFLNTPHLWIKVRRIKRYRAGMQYAK